jgi:hypothetical protein
MHNTNDRPTHRPTDRSVRPGAQSQPTAADYDISQTINQPPTVINASTPTSYRNGYVEGEVAERRYQQALVARDNDNAARGLLLGVLLTSLIGLIVGAFYLMSEQQTPEPVAPQPTLAPTTAPPADNSTNTQIRERVIRQTETRVVPVPVPVTEPAPPQAPAPAVPQQQAPVQPSAVEQPAPQAPADLVEPQPSVEPQASAAPETTDAPAPEAAPAQ